MSEDGEILENGKYELLNVFAGDEDKRGTDLLAMSDFFGTFISKIEAEMGKETKVHPFVKTNFF